VASGSLAFTGGGDYLLAKSRCEAVFGSYNEDYTPEEPFGWSEDDRLFIVANGTSEGNRSNAVTILKNGRTGIGTSNPQNKLDIEGGIAVGSGYSGSTTSPANGAIIEGNVGIGTTSPDAKLALSTSANIVQTVLSNSTVGSWMAIGNSDTGGKYFQLISTGYANGGGAGNLLIAHGASPGSAAGIPVIIRGDNNRVGIGTNTPSSLLHVNGDITASCGVLTCSDFRYKTNIVPVPQVLKKIRNLKGVYYHWNIAQHPEKAFTNDRQIGVIAQELEMQFPELVHTDDDGYKTVDYPKLSAVLLNAVNELSTNQQKIMAENAVLKEQLNEAIQALSDLEVLKALVVQVTEESELSGAE
jgi:hypothetical protein